MSTEIRFIPGAGDLAVKPDVGGVHALLSNVWTWLPECALCGDLHAESLESPKGAAVCGRCAEHIANLYHFARSGEYLTWANPERPGAQSSRRQPISATLRSEILLRDTYRCRYCGGFTGGLVLDHVVPWSRGGADTLENLVAACLPCNSKKRDRTPDEAGMPLLEVPSA